VSIMKSTEGESTKPKTAIRSVGTKAKAKKKVTKKTLRKKTSAKKKDTKKTVRKKKIASEQVQMTRNRRSERTRNNSFSYMESSDTEDYDETWGSTPKPKSTRARARSKKDADTTAAAAAKDDTDIDEEDQDKWEVYDQGNAESDEAWNEHYRRLQEFHSEHGHSGVPVNELWNQEPNFCEWVSRQRQLFREIRSGYRIASLREEGRWKRLRVLRFPLDYENWLWERRYNQLCENLDGEKYTEDICLNATLKEWVQRQTHLGICGRIDSERRINLEKLGIVVGRANESDWAYQYG